MDRLIELGVLLIVWLQNLGTWLVRPMEFFSFLGTEEFYLIIAPIILWCWDASLGLRLGLFLMINAGFNSIFKLLLAGPRPYWLSENVIGYASETSYGVPSGHSQNAVVFWGTIAKRLKKPRGWIAVLILIFLIGLSRMVLGVHFPHDVLIGWLLGTLILWALFKLSRPAVNWLHEHSFNIQVLSVFLVSLGLILIGVVVRAVTGSTVPMKWITFAAQSFPSDPIAPQALSGLISNAGAFFGLAAGALWLGQRGGFQTKGKAWQLLLRYLIGLIGVMLLWFGLGELFPRGEALLPFMLRYLRYALVGLWVTGLAPRIFQLLKLSENQ